MDRAYNWA